MSSNGIESIGLILVVMSCVVVVATMSIQASTQYKQTQAAINAQPAAITKGGGGGGGGGGGQRDSETLGSGGRGGDGRIININKDSQCNYTRWSEWSTSCRNGVRERTRGSIAMDGATCGPLKETKPCTCVGVWEDEIGSRCGYATKKQIFHRLTPEATQSTCVAANGAYRYVPSRDPAWCLPTTDQNYIWYASPSVTPTPSIKTDTPDCIGNWEDDRDGCQCSLTEKRQVFKILKAQSYGGTSCPRDPITMSYNRNVSCTPPSYCPSGSVNAHQVRTTTA